MTRTFGAAIGAVIFILFFSYMADRLTNPVQASAVPTVATAQP